MLERLAERVWWTKSQSSLPSQWMPGLALIYSLPLRSEYLFTLQQSVALYDAPLSRSAPCSNAQPLQKSRRNYRSYVWTEALSGIVFVPTKELSFIVWTQPNYRKLPLNSASCAWLAFQEGHSHLIPRITWWVNSEGVPQWKGIFPCFACFDWLIL